MHVLLGTGGVQAREGSAEAQDVGSTARGTPPVTLSTTGNHLCSMKRLAGPASEASLEASSRQGRPLLSLRMQAHAACEDGASSLASLDQLLLGLSTEAMAHERVIKWGWQAMKG